MKLKYILPLLLVLSACGGSGGNSGGGGGDGGDGGGGDGGDGGGGDGGDGGSGDGGGSDPITYVVSGTIHPDISFDRVCHDVNVNGACDDSEPFSVSNSYSFTVRDATKPVIVETNFGNIVSSGNVSPISIFNYYFNKRFPSLTEIERETFVRSTFFLNSGSVSNPGNESNAAILSVLNNAQNVRNNLTSYSVSDDAAILQYVIQTVFYYGVGSAATAHYNKNVRSNIDVLKKPVVSVNFLETNVGYDVSQSQGAGSRYTKITANSSGVTMQRYFTNAGIVSLEGTEFTVNVIGQSSYEAADTSLNYWHAFKKNIPCTINGNPSTCRDNSSRFNPTTGNFEIGDPAGDFSPARQVPMKHKMGASRLNLSGIPMKDAINVCKYSASMVALYERVPNNVTFPEGSYCYNVTYTFVSDEFILEDTIYPEGGASNPDTKPRFRSMDNVNGFGSLDRALFKSFNELNTWLSARTTGVYSEFPFTVSFDSFPQFAVELDSMDKRLVNTFNINRGKTYGQVDFIVPASKKQMTARTILGREGYLLEGGDNNKAFFMAVERRIGESISASPVEGSIITGSFYRANFPRPYVDNRNNLLINTVLNEVAFTAVQPYL